jgi:hypothetical protein
MACDASGPATCDTCLGVVDDPELRNIGLDPVTGTCIKVCVPASGWQGNWA